MEHEGTKNMKREYQKIPHHIEEIAHQVIGAAIEVHKTLGPGYLESVYEESLCVELVLKGINFVRQHPVHVNYKGNYVGEGRIDIFVENLLPLELKTVETLLPIHTAQLLSYLKALNCPLGLLINFNSVVLRQSIKRVILT